MKKLNNKKTIMERGGLMIEALAMLGLIAVVTPTMYKKSAERTMEVDDINTSSTIRTIINAADSYVATNYSTIVGDMKEQGETVRSLPITNIEEFLPYGFDINKSLYNYNVPNISIRRQGNNLTAFVLFPAKASKEDGLGQERTSRIAALIGANGGYVSDKNGGKSARGIGGIWKLDSSEFSNTFSGIDPNAYSIVTASAEPINSATGGEIDNDKYLQRGLEGDDTWHNTMRTDLYMGNADTVNDDTIYKNAGYHSILGVNQLLIGEKDKEKEGVKGGKYGLYIGDGLGLGNTNAYIVGSLEAAFKNEEGIAGTMFKVDKAELSYGNPENKRRPFKVYKDGNIYTEGRLTVLGDADIGFDIGEKGWNNIGLGYISGTVSGTGNSEYVLNITRDASGETRHLNIMDNAMKVTGIGNNKTISFINRNPGDDGYQNGLGEISDMYNPDNGQAPQFPLKVNSNMSVSGILAAGQLDTKKIRTTSLIVGSQYVDDQYKWMEVNENGIVIKDPVKAAKKEIGTSMNIDSNKIELLTAASGNAYNQAKLNMKGDKLVAKGKKVLISTVSNGYEGLDSTEPANNIISLRTEAMEAKLNGSTLTIGKTKILPPSTGNIVGGRPNETDASKVHTIFDGGRVELKQADIKVKKDGKIVFAVKGSNAGYDDDDLYLTPYQPGKPGFGYNAVLRGNVAFSAPPTSNSYGRDTLSISSIYNQSAMVNILHDNSANLTQEANNILVVDANKMTSNVGKPYSKTYLDPNNGIDHIGADNDGGTIYMRKGYLEVSPKTSATTSENAYDSYGTIVASRLVANNNNEAYKFPSLYSKADYEDQNTFKAYDTYMVNPAYTSVMHDIKLTTRGGARLSDILPDFINKGIYVINNTYNDNIHVLKFKLEGNNGKYSVMSSEGTAPTTSTSTTKGENWASPYMGFVPAPQCPPGYGRAITMNPLSFRMGQVGNIVKHMHNTGGKDFGSYIDNDNIYSMRGSLDDLPPTPSFKQLEITNSSGGNISGQIRINKGTATSAEFRIDSADGLNMNTTQYVLTSDSENGPVPVTLQQSDWLATRVIPLCEKYNGIGGNECNNSYSQGWAAIMGFLYRTSQYSNLVLLTGNFPSRNDENSWVNSAVLWNLFPVAAGTLEAYGTVYCYFDRKKNSATGDAESYINFYSNIKDTIADSREKKANQKYLERLNDPALPYNEMW